MNLRQLRILFNLLSAYFLCVFMIHGQSSEIETLDALVIRGAADSTSDLDRPVTSYSVPEEVIEQRRTEGFTEILGDLPGVLLQQTSNGQGSPFLRGFTGYRTLAVIDGVRYGHSAFRDGPNEYFSLIDPLSLQSVELVQGPGSVLYGSDAIGGTMFLQTRSADFQTRERDVLYAGGSQSYDFHSGQRAHVFRTTAEIGEGGKWGLLLGFSEKDFGGIDAARFGKLPYTGYRERGFDARLDIAISDQWTLTLNHQNFEQDGAKRTHSTIFARSFSGTTTGSDLRREKDEQRSLSYLRLSGIELGSWVEEAALTLSLQRFDELSERVRSNGRREVSAFDTQMLGVDLQLKSETTFGTLTYGFDLYHDAVDSQRTDFNADGSIGEIRVQGSVGDDATYDQLGVFLQNSYDITDAIRVTGGVRYSYTKADIGRFEDPSTGSAASFSDDNSALVGSLRASYAFGQEMEWRIWAGASQAFRAPNIGDLSRFGARRSDEFEIAATNLDPEKFLTYEAGVKRDLAGVQFGLTYYYTQIDDYITSAPTGGQIVEPDGSITSIVSKQNGSEGYVQGVEFDWLYQYNNAISLYGNFTWLEGRLEQILGGNLIEEPLSRIQPLTVNVGARWEPLGSKFWLGLDAQFAGKADKLSESDRGDTQRIPPGGTPGYALVDFVGGYHFNECYSANLGLHNVLDSAYRTHGSGTNAPGRSLVMGFKAKF